MKNIPQLPKSDDEYFDGAEKYTSSNVKIKLCQTHGKNWMKHVGYVDNGDGTGSCQFCSWGFIIPGFMRIHEGKVYDLRDR
jgi:hypothetical protein